MTYCEMRAEPAKAKFDSGTSYLNDLLKEQN